MSNNVFVCGIGFGHGKCTYFYKGSRVALCSEKRVDQLCFSEIDPSNTSGGFRFVLFLDVKKHLSVRF